MEKWFQEIQELNHVYNLSKINQYVLPSRLRQGLKKIGEHLGQFLDQAGIIVAFYKRKDLQKSDLNLLEASIRNLSIIAIEFKDIFTNYEINLEKVSLMTRSAFNLVCTIHNAQNAAEGEYTSYATYGEILRFKNLYLITFDTITDYLSRLEDLFVEKGEENVEVTKVEFLHLLDMVPKISVELLDALNPGQIIKKKPQIVFDFQSLMLQIVEYIRQFQLLQSKNFFDEEILRALDELEQYQKTGTRFPIQIKNLKEVNRKDLEPSFVHQLGNLLTKLPFPSFGEELGEWTIFEQNPQPDSPFQSPKSYNLKVNWGKIIIQSGKILLFTLNIPQGINAEKIGSTDNPSLLLRTQTDGPREFVFTPFFLKSLTKGVDYLLKIIHKVQEYGPFNLHSSDRENI